MAFKIAGSLAFKAAAENANPVILEPILELEVDVPDDTVGDVVGDLNGRRGRLQGMDPIAAGKTRVRAQVPMATMTRYALDLRSITKGRGRFRQNISHYDELPHPEQQALMAEYQKRRSDHESDH
jgi:elongation factor G